MIIAKKHYTSIWYDNKKDRVKIIDQTLLPHKFEIKELYNLNHFIRAIFNMEVRGAPLIGVTAAFGMYIASLKDSSTQFLDSAVNFLIQSRPTAVNLSWAVNKIKSEYYSVAEDKRSEHILNLAKQIRDSDINACSSIGDNGLNLIKKMYEEKKSTINILTHCNAGWLAAVDWGTALAPIFKAKKHNIPIHVWVDETRPRNQGFNLTAWELMHEEIDCSLIVDNVGGHLMQHNQIDMCIVGTDRTTLTGDVCNKIGTYLKALAAYDNHIPFYVSAPISSIDFDIKDGIADIPIETRDPREVTSVWGIDEKNETKSISIIPKNAKAVNYAFDVTPSKYISKLITEKGVIDPNEKSIKKLKL